MIYGLCTSRQNNYNSERLAITLRSKIRRMLRLGRRPSTTHPKVVMEQWVDWQIKSPRRTASVITKEGATIANMLNIVRSKWAEQVSKFGLEDKPQHILKYMFLWRSVA